jgi:hypothetical protein
MAVPYTFATATSSIPLSQLDANFATGITLGNTTVYLGNTTTSIGNLTLTNATISSVATTFPNSFLANSSVTIGSTNISLGGTSTTLAGLTGVTSSAITDSGLTSGRVTYATTGGLLTDSANMTFNGTTLTLANDASISGLTVGKGGGAISSNTSVGLSALASNSTGAFNATFGSYAGTNTTSSNNAFFGYAAGQVNSSGSNNTSSGAYALYKNSTGSNNVAIGNASLNENTTASNNTAVGYQAGYSNTTGNNSVNIGRLAGYYATINNYNTFVGVQAGYNSNVTTGGNGYNTFMGYAAGFGATTGYNNTFIGSKGSTGTGAGHYVTTGNANSILGGYDGNQGGLDIRTASNYIVLSDGDGNPRAYSDNNGTWTFGGSANGKLSSATNNTLNVSFVGSGYNGMDLDDSSSTSGCRFVGFSLNNGATLIGSIARVSATSAVVYNTTSDYRLKTVIAPVSNAGERIDALEPIEYDWNAGGRTRGFLAHKFAEVYPDSVTGEKDAVDAEGNPVYQAMQAATSEVMADLIAEIQSLRKRVAQLESK